MDRYQRQVMAMHIRRLGDGDKAQYIPHFAEARMVTAGEYQEYLDDSERKLDVLRSLPFTEVGMSVHVDVMKGAPPLLPSLLSAAVSPVAAPAAEIVAMTGRCPACGKTGEGFVDCSCPVAVEPYLGMNNK
jgi:hypothetical protein